MAVHMMNALVLGIFNNVDIDEVCLSRCGLGPLCILRSSRSVMVSMMEEAFSHGSILLGVCRKNFDGLMSFLDWGDWNLCWLRNWNCNQRW